MSSAECRPRARPPPGSRETSVAAGIPCARKDLASVAPPKRRPLERPSEEHAVAGSQQLGDARVGLEGAQRESLPREHLELGRGADPLQVDDEGRQIRRRGETPRGVGPGALHAHLLGREQQHLDVGAHERRPRGELLRDAHQNGAGTAVVERARAARRQEGPRRERDEGGDAVGRGGPGRDRAEQREPPRAARSARPPAAPRARPAT